METKDGAFVIQMIIWEHLHCFSHHVFHLDQPSLHVAFGCFWVGDACEHHHLPLHTIHGGDVKIFLKLQRIDALKTLLQERLHTEGVLRLRQNLQQLIVGQEEESRECQSLRLKVVVEPLLNNV